MAGVSLLCAETAYEALRALRSARGDAILSQLVEVSGTGGAPQPGEWVILLKDPVARGGVREIKIVNGNIVSERTPLRGFSSVSDMPVIDFSRLNLDSDGAFRLANQEAIRKKIGFDSIDYSLRGQAGGPPVWSLKLYNYLGTQVGDLEVSAESATVKSQLSHQEKSPSTAASSSEEGESHRWEEWTEGGGLIGRVQDIGKRTGNTVRKTVLQVGGAIEEFFTGKRTVDEGVRE